LIIGPSPGRCTSSSDWAGGSGGGVRDGVMFETAVVWGPLSLLVEVNDALSIVSGVAAEIITELDFPCCVARREISPEPEAFEEFDAATLGLSLDLEGGLSSSRRRSVFAVVAMEFSGISTPDWSCLELFAEPDKGGLLLSGRTSCWV